MTTDLEAIEREAAELRAHVVVAQEWLESGEADNLPAPVMDALEAMTAACDAGLDHIKFRLRWLDAKRNRSA